MMINETILLLTPFEDCSEHKVCKHLGGYQLSVPIDECFYQPLKQIFSRVILYDYFKRMLEIGMKATNREVIELVRKEHFKYALWVAWGEYYEIQESTLTAIRKEGTVVVGWFFDDEVRFDYYSKWWIPYVDYFVTNDPQSVSKYNQLGAWAILGIPDTGAAEQVNWSKIEERYDVTFVGSLRADREEYIKVLQERNIPIHLFGTAGNRFVSYEEMTTIFGTSKINLNFSKTYKDMKFGMKGRIFKVCLAGGFLLTEYFPGIERFFQIDKEITCFHSPEEMVDKIVYYLNHDEERRAIARAGWERATAEYTSFHIVSKVFQEIEKDVATRSQETRPTYPELKIPRAIRNFHSQYFCQWGAAFSEENYKGLWRETLALSISYNPLNFPAWYHYVIGFLHYSVRLSLIQLYRRMYFGVGSKLRAKK